MNLLKIAFLCIATIPMLLQGMDRDASGNKDTKDTINYIPKSFNTNDQNQINNNFNEDKNRLSYIAECSKQLDLNDLVDTFENFFSITYLSEYYWAPENIPYYYNPLYNLVNLLHALNKDKAMSIAFTNTKSGLYKGDIYPALLKLLECCYACAKKLDDGEINSEDCKNEVFGIVSDIAKKLEGWIGDYSKDIVKPVKDAFDAAQNASEVIYALCKTEKELEEKIAKLTLEVKKGAEIVPAGKGGAKAKNMARAKAKEAHEKLKRELRDADLIRQDVKRDIQVATNKKEDLIYKTGCSLISALFEFGKKSTYLLHNHAILKIKNLVKNIPIDLTKSIFKMIRPNPGLKGICDEAFDFFSKNSFLCNRFSYTLQSYMCCLGDKNKDSAKGFNWEIAVASFLGHYHDLEGINVLKFGSTYYREFDAETGAYLIECKNQTSLTKTAFSVDDEAQLRSQAAIAKYCRKTFIFISKVELSQDKKDFLYKNGINYIDPEHTKCGKLDASLLYDEKSIYCIND